jgi:hypothetical protein
MHATCTRATVEKICAGSAMPRTSQRKRGRWRGSSPLELCGESMIMMRYMISTTTKQAAAHADVHFVRELFQVVLGQVLAVLDHLQVSHTCWGGGE